jgi:hypothetical protein
MDAQLILVIANAATALDVLSMISRFASVFRAHGRVFLILRADVPADIKHIRALASRHKFDRTPALIVGNTVVVGSSRICLALSNIIKAIRARDSSDGAREPSRPSCPTNVDSYMYHAILDNPQDCSDEQDEDPEKVRAKMEQRMAQYRARVEASRPPMPKGYVPPPSQQDTDDADAQTTRPHPLEVKDATRPPAAPWQDTRPERAPVREPRRDERRAPARAAPSLPTRSTPPLPAQRTPQSTAIPVIPESEIPQNVDDESTYDLTPIDDPNASYAVVTSNRDDVLHEIAHSRIRNAPKETSRTSMRRS